MTTVVLDSHVLHWWSAEPKRISRAANEALSGADELAVAAISWFELAWLAGHHRIACVPAKLTRKLGRYEVPVFRLGRLAVDLSMQGQGLGGDLLLAAGERALAVASEVGGVALAIDAKDENAARWYERFGALSLLDDPRKLILPLSVVADAITTAARRRSR